MCTHQKEILFGVIENEIMYLNDAGEQALQCWNEIPDHFPNLELDAFIIMPNHIHGIIVIAGPDNYLPDHHDPVRAKNISPRHDEPVRANNYSPLHNAPYGRNMFRPYGPVWQHNYYEHIIRNEPELFRIRKYILGNPAKWYSDKMNPDMSTDAVRESDAAYGLEAWMV